ncbi:hypothetical protein LIER_42673 [Lithospermum erythrorhizon]|uniref:Uncharacterized protein n=1 Tax=Lithospermum erythrorhizon TaxID=34254 RepID=A0AAV3NQT9_LITER
MKSASSHLLPTAMLRLRRLSSTHFLNPTKVPYYYINNPNNNCCSSYYSTTMTRNTENVCFHRPSKIECRYGSVVVKIFTASNPNCWQNQPQFSGSGFVISGRMILTNDRVVDSYDTFIQVMKFGSKKKYIAKVKAIGDDFELAILVVNNEEFWEGMESLSLVDARIRLIQSVSIIGYPQGADNISLTQGIARVHGVTRLIYVSSDINKGNNGGPAFVGESLLGVAIQTTSKNYIIPIRHINHFITGVQCGKYVGFCSMGLTCQTTQNSQLREYFRMHPHMTGVLLCKINPLSYASEVLKTHDIILSFDGLQIANDGTVTFRNGDRIPFDHLVSMKKPTEISYFKVLRDGEELEFSFKLRQVG